MKAMPATIPFKIAASVKAAMQVAASRSRA
jgi:hypothetical protein